VANLVLGLIVQEAENPSRRDKHCPGQAKPSFLKLSYTCAYFSQSPLLTLFNFEDVAEFDKRLIQVSKKPINGQSF